MLEEIALTLYHTVDPVAQAWLARGASAVRLVEGDGTLLFSWPEGAAVHLPDLSVTIQLGGGLVSDLQLCGVVGADVEARLHADAQSVGQIVNLERELFDMTEELVTAQDQLVALFELTQSLNNQLTLKAAMAAMAQAGQRLVRSEAAFVVLGLEEKQMRIVQYPPAHLPDEIVLQLFTGVESNSAEIVRQGSEADLPAGITTLFLKRAGIPGKAHSGLGFVNSLQGLFDQPQMKLARTIADQAIARLENVLLHQELVNQARIQTELELARTVQLRLLPQAPPRVSGLNLAPLSKPALEVGGDFYSFIQWPDSPLTVVVGDVSGKGMAAALLMAMMLTAVRSKAYTSIKRRPDELLALTNELMYEDFSEVGMFATVFIGQYHAPDRLFSYVNAGHSPVIYRPAQGQAAMLEPDWPPLGVLPVAMCDNQQIQLGPGDLLVIATDGFSEAENEAGALFGYDRLLALVNQLADRSAEEIRDALFDAIALFAGRQPRSDDQTLVVVKGAESQ